MPTQFENYFSNYTQQFASTAARAHRLALENAESAFDLQIKTFEHNANATTDFLGEFAQIRDLNAYQKLWPKGVQLAHETLERLTAASRGFVELGLKTSEAIGQLAKQQFVAASDHASASVDKTSGTKQGK